MKNRVYLILLALADSDLHGLGIAGAVQELSSGRTRLWPASLYGTLDELDESGLIEELDDPRQRPADESEKKKKRFYRLTRAGHRALAAETRMMLRNPGEHRPGSSAPLTAPAMRRANRKVLARLKQIIEGTTTT